MLFGCYLGAILQPNKLYIAKILLQAEGFTHASMVRTLGFAFRVCF
jgi:hypothetical protein